MKLSGKKKVPGIKEYVNNGFIVKKIFGHKLRKVY